LVQAAVSFPCKGLRFIVPATKTLPSRLSCPRDLATGRGHRDHIFTFPRIC